MLTGLSDQQLCLLTGLQIWRDQILGVSLAFVVIGDGAGAGDRGEVVLLERACWSKGCAFAFLLRLCR
jgi:hypothetical protein